MICTFFGHKDIPFSIYPIIVEEIDTLIINRSICCFLVGNQGNFDKMVLEALRELKHQYSHISYNVVLAYVPNGREKHESLAPSETILPDGIENVPKRFAISWRNKWLIKKSQLIVCYIDHSWGGAAQFVEYGIMQGKEIINLATKNKSE